MSRAHERLKHDLSKIKAGGKDPEVIENVRVRLNKAEKETVKLGDVASVVPRGRNVAVLVGEKDVSISFAAFWMLGNWNKCREEELALFLFEEKDLFC